MPAPVQIREINANEGVVSARVDPGVIGNIAGHSHLRRFRIDQVPFAVARPSRHVPLDPARVHELVDPIASKVRIQVALIPRTAGRGRKGIPAGLPAGTVLVRLFALKRPVVGEERATAVEDPEVIVDGINFVIVHDRHADIAPVHPVGRKGIRDEGALGELHGGRIVDLSSVEIDLVLASLDVKEREVGAGEVVVQQIDRSRRLRVFSCFHAELEEVLKIRVDQMPQEQQPCAPQVELGAFTDRAVCAIVTEHAEEFREILGITGISPGIIPPPRCFP